MIYKFTDFEKIQESKGLKTSDLQKIYEENKVFGNILSGLNVSSLSQSLNDELRKTINNETLIANIIKKSNESGLLDASVKVANGEYTNIRNILYNIGLGLTALSAGIFAYKKYKKIKIGKNLETKFNFDGKKFNDVLKGEYIKTKEKITGINGKGVIPKGTSGTVSVESGLASKTPTGSEYNTNIYYFNFIPSGATASKKIPIYQEELGVKTDKLGFLKSIGANIKDRASIVATKTLESLKNNGMLAITGGAATGITATTAIIYSDMSEVLESLIGFFSNIPAIPGFDTGSSIRELEEMKVLLKPETKQEFLAMFKSELEKTSEFSSDLDFTKAELLSITANSFNSPKAFASIGNNPENIGFLVTYQLSDIIFKTLKGDVAKEVENLIPNETATKDDGFTY